MREPLNMNSGATISIPLLNHDQCRINRGTEEVPLWTDVFDRTMFYYSRGERQGSVLDLSGYAWQADAKGIIGTTRNVYDMCLALRNPHDKSYYESGDGKTYIDLINEKGVWLWGSTSDGGVCIVKCSNDRYVFIGLAGLYQNSTNSNIYYYAFTCTTTGSNDDGLNQGEMTEVMFYNGEYINGIYTCNMLWTPSNLMWQKRDFSYFDLDITRYIYNTSYVDLLAATNNDQWEAAPPLMKNYLPQAAWTLTNSDGTLYYDNTGFTGIGRDDSPWLPGYNKVGMSIYGNASVNGNDPYKNAGNATPAGGNGAMNNHCDPSHSTDESQFTTDAINSGFFTLYNPDKTDLQDFNDFLFTDISDSMSTQLKRLISNPLDYVIFIAMVHFHPNTMTTAPIKFCGIDSGVSAPVITKQMQEIDFGTITISEQSMTESFLSYEPYMKASVFLPYIGVQHINCDDIMGGTDKNPATLSLKYWVDLLTGSCIAQLEVTRPSRSYSDSVVPGVVIGEYTGNVFQNLPLTATDWRGLFGSVLQFAGGVVGLATGNAAGLGAMASAVIGEKQHVSRSGQLGANYGYMGRQRPCLILERPVVHMPDEFGRWEGYTSGMLVELGRLHGYTELDESTLWVYDTFDGITEREAEMLRSICNSGFYI